MGLEGSSAFGGDAWTGLLDITLGACEAAPGNTDSLDAISPSISVKGYGSISNPLKEKKTKYI